ncbi:hypothetical protein DFH09DRAFT_1332953 [Mycena vulgaris]|nr:hypothetical protein DFH09DRAFT_1332953 [Mycena vulgaris]
MPRYIADAKIYPGLGVLGRHAIALLQPSPTASIILSRKECTGAAQLVSLFNQWLSWAKEAALASVFLLLLRKPSPASANGRDQQPSRPSGIDDTIFNSRNKRYSTAVIIAGTTLNVNVHALHIIGANPPGGIGAFDDTGVVKKKKNYGGGASINGTIGLAQVSIAGYTIPRQAFLNVTKIWILYDPTRNTLSIFQNVGPTAGIQKTITTAGPDGPGLGKSVLSSIFDMNPTKGRFFALALSRLGDTKDTANASLSISEYERQYARVQWRARQPFFPATSKSWHILSDGVSVNGVSVNGVSIPWTANDAGTSSGKILVGPDSGTSNIIMRPEIRDCIYSTVPGAVLAKNSSIGNQGHWSGDRDVWVVLCNTSASFAAYFSRIHPLDFMSLTSRTAAASQPAILTHCSFGDTFLRNVYPVFSFGDNTTLPYIQLLPLTNEWEASQDFFQCPPTAPREEPPGTRTRRSHPRIRRSFRLDLDSIEPGVTAGNLAAADGASSTDSSTVAKYAPTIIGLLGANLVTLLVLVFLGVMAFVRRSRQIGLARAPGSRYVPERVKDESLLAPSFDEEKRYSDI